MTSIKIINQVSEMQRLGKVWAFSADTALVPTMGFLHEGHLDLVRKAAKGSTNVVVSIFVNPLQFGPSEDFEKYPRNLDRDLELLQSVGATHVFMPQAEDITPPEMRVVVDPGEMGNVLCGKYRPGHFRGVCTIVLKLFHLIMPGRAYFGWKDAQQFLILRKMVNDLNVPVELIGVETRREPDGLAMSSRNTYLNHDERLAAVALSRGLTNVKTALSDGIDSASKLKYIFEEEIKRETLLRVQYIEVSRTDTLEPIDNVMPGNTLVAVAVYAGHTRLIDNVRL